MLTDYLPIYLGLGTVGTVKSVHFVTEHYFGTATVNVYEILLGLSFYISYNCNLKGRSVPDPDP